MSHEKIFRTLLLACISTGIIAVVAGFGLVTTLPAPLQAYLTSSAGQEVSATEGVILVAVILVIVINLIGLWLFKPWAKTLYVALTVFSFLMAPTYGPVVMNAWEAMFYDLAILLDGVILVLLFTGPVAAKFSKTPAPQQV